MSVLVETTDNQYEIRVPPQIGKYKTVRTIGRGGYAVVIEAIDTKTDKHVAIKIINRIEITKSNMLVYLENELRLMSRFDHPNIVKVIDILYELEIIMIVMEYLPNGDLQGLLSLGIHISFEEQLRIAKELLEALCYLHKRGVAHRDLKPQNILFDEEMHVKLIDFGLSKETSNLTRTVCGTPLFMAPEVIKSNTYDPKRADIWAIGVILHLCATGAHFPWISRTEMQFVNDMLANDLEMFIEPKGVIGNVIKHCLIYDPNARATAEELLQMLTCGVGQTDSLGLLKNKLTKRTLTDTSLPRLNIVNSCNVLQRARRISDKGPQFLRPQEKKIKFKYF